MKNKKIVQAVAVLAECHPELLNRVNTDELSGTLPIVWLEMGRAGV